MSHFGVLKKELVQGTEEWLKWRESGVTSSDMPAIMGKSPYRTKRDVWFEKAGFGELEDEGKKHLFEMGHEMEEEIRQLVFKFTKTKFVPACFQNGFFLASLDGFSEDYRILEAKLVGKAVLKQAAEKSVIPEHHMIQIQTQMYVSDTDHALWAARAPKVSEGVIIEVVRNEDLIQTIKEEGYDFWGSVQADDPPPLSKDDYFFVSLGEHQMKFRALEHLRRQKDMIDGAYEKLETEIKKWAPHPKIKCGNIILNEISRSGSIDYSKIPEVKSLQKDYLETFRKSGTTYKSIRFVKGK